jgi:hypothetical protein
MCPIAFFVASAVLGIQFGWEPQPEGGVQYIIQLNPDALEALRSGEPIESDIRPELLGEVRSFRIVVGEKKLSHQLPARPAALLAAPAALPPNPASKPLAEQPAAYVAAAPAGNSASSASAAPPVVQTVAVETKPWLPLWLSIVALFASLGGNFFLAWITWDARSRYRSLLGPAVA